MTTPLKVNWSTADLVGPVDINAIAGAINAINAALAALPSGGGSSLPPYFQMIGAQPANTSLTITHGLNNLNVTPRFVRSSILVGLTTAVPAQVVDFGWRTSGPNAIIVDLTDAVAANEFAVWVNQFPQTGINTAVPTPGVITAANPTLSSVDLAITGGTGSGIGLAGVNWYRNGVFVGSSMADTFTDTTATFSTLYSYTARRYDFIGQEGPVSNTATATTLTPGPVAPIGVAVQNLNVTGGTVSTTPTYALGSLRIAIAVISVSHAEWVSNKDYLVSVTGSQSGGWVRSAEPTPTDTAFNDGSQPSGSVHVFYKLMPSTAWTSDTVTASFASNGTYALTPVDAMISIQQYVNVDQVTPFGTPVVDRATAPPSGTVASNAGDYTMAALGIGSLPGGYNQTLIGVAQGAAAAGYANYLLHGHAATTVAGSVVHSVATPAAYSIHAMILTNIRKAGS